LISKAIKSVTNVFTVIVFAPTLAPLNNQTINAGQTVSFAASATDNDNTRTLTFREGVAQQPYSAGAFRPLPRLADMDGDGIEQAVLYPTLLLGLPALHDAEFAEAQANAYNEWLAEYCAAAPNRLFGVAAVPHQDLARAVRVIRRARELGLVGVFLRPNPSVDGKKFNDPIYDPIWRTCEEVDLPVGLHPFLAPDMPGACRALGFYELKAEGVEMARTDDASSASGGGVLEQANGFTGQFGGVFGFVGCAFQNFIEFFNFDQLDGIFFVFEEIRNGLRTALTPSDQDPSERRSSAVWGWLNGASGV